MMVRPRGMSRAWKKSPPHDPGRSGPSPWSVPRAADDEFADLLIRLREEGVEGYPPSMGLRNALKAALIYMRHNIPQVVIGEQLNVSQLTISRAIKAMTDAIARALKDVLLTAEEVPEGCDYVLGGTLFPCWSWRNHRELWSGKHKTTGMNVQILVLPGGRLVWASDPYPGSVHDVAALDASGLLEGMDRGNGPLRVDRQQGVRGKGNDHPAQEAPQRRTERNREGGQQERQQDPPSRKSAPSPTSSPGESSTPPTADPWKHSSRPSPQHSHYTPSRPPPE